MLAIGNQTQVERILVRHGAGDGIEIWGGVVPLKHAIVDACEGNLYDCSFGWSGFGQFWIGRSGAEGGGAGVQAANSRPPLELTDTPITRPFITNVTLVGAGNPATTGPQVGVVLQRGTGAYLFNCIVEGFPVAGLDVDDEVTCTQNYPDHLFVKNSIFFRNGTSGREHTMPQPEPGEGQDETLWAAPCTRASEILVDDPTNILATTSPITDPHHPTVPDFRGQGADVTTNPFSPPDINGWFWPAPYRGAVSPDPLEEDWTRKPWISWEER